MSVVLPTLTSILSNLALPCDQVLQKIEVVGDVGLRLKALEDQVSTYSLN